MYFGIRFDDTAVLVEIEVRSRRRTPVAPLPRRPLALKLREVREHHLFAQHEHPEADHFFKGDGESSFAGGAVTDVGDVDGDGLGDIIVAGMPDNVATAYLLLSSGALSTSGDTIDLRQADLTLLGAGLMDNAGTSVSAAGDVDGDGLSDLLIGAPADSGFNDRYGGAMLITSGQLIEHALP